MEFVDLIRRIGSLIFSFLRCLSQTQRALVRDHQGMHRCRLEIQGFKDLLHLHCRLFHFTKKLHIFQILFFMHYRKNNQFGYHCFHQIIDLSLISLYYFTASSLTFLIQTIYYLHQKVFSLLIAHFVQNLNFNQHTEIFYNYVVYQKKKFCEMTLLLSLKRYDFFQRLDDSFHDADLSHCIMSHYATHYHYLNFKLIQLDNCYHHL